MKILNFRNLKSNQSYLSVSVLGNSLKLNIIYTNSSSVNLNKKEAEIDLFLPKKYQFIDNINIINISIQKLYDTLAETEIEYAMEVARHLLGFAPLDYSIKRMNNEFYKCIKNQIIINPDITKFSRTIINKTIIKAFCKIKYKTNSIKYKQILNKALNDYDNLKFKEYYNKFSNVS